ncbi:MAG: HAD family hydrolase [Christensenellaceae bacterium]|jgi:FMN phosphatase YigB (HAD superfamily)|nr:HAD family hydrolase [Christensenellaceae bacterium]
MQQEFDAIFYDLGGTLRLVERDAAFEAQARRRIAELCGETGDPDAFCKFLDYRYEGYRKWCFETMREAPEAELWTKWLTPEYPRALIERNAIELTIEYRNKDGRRVVAPNGAQSIRDLHQNGYRLGIISNLVTSREIPDWLESDKLADYFDVVLLSCVEGIRKPDPRLSAKACDMLGVPPERCVYIGDNLKRDIEGTRLAGYGMFILYTTPEKLSREKITDENRPDAVIYDFAELKEIFPGAPSVAWDKIRRA